MRKGCLALLALFSALAWAAASAPEQAEVGPDAGASNELDGLLSSLRSRRAVDYAQSAPVKTAVQRALSLSEGTPRFLELVRQFELSDQNSALLQLAINNSLDPLGADAMRWLLRHGGRPSIEKILAGNDAFATINVLLALGQLQQAEANDLLLPVAIDAKRPLAIRKQAVRALTTTEAGARLLLAEAKAYRLADDLQFTVSMELQGSAWRSICGETAALMPLPIMADEKPVPVLGTLVQMLGNPARGKSVFERPASGCVRCHQLAGTGREIGPVLGDIGRKLEREELFEAILAPSATIAFGYEAHVFELNTGDDAFGLIVRETPDQLSVRDIDGRVTTFARSAVVTRKQLSTSIMPSDLQRTMTCQDLVDLISFLAAQRK